MRKTALETIGMLVEEDPRVIFVGSDLGAGTLEDVMNRHPDRVLMEGIAEQHLVSFAAGLALEGFTPFVHTIATFLTRRALEQVVIDVALDCLPVILVGAGGGMVYAPLGPTHQAIDDFALMSAIPGMNVVAPADPLEMQSVLRVLLAAQMPAYVRVAKGGESVISADFLPIEAGKVRMVFEGKQVAVLTTGALLHECIEAGGKLRAEGVELTVAHFPFVAPLDREAVVSLSSSHNHLIVVEEHVPHGGLSAAIANVLSEIGFSSPLHRLTLPPTFAAKYGTQAEHWRMHGLDAAGIRQKVLEILRIDESS